MYEEDGKAARYDKHCDDMDNSTDDAAIKNQASKLPGERANFPEWAKFKGITKRYFLFFTLLRFKILKH